MNKYPSPGSTPPSPAGFAHSSSSQSTLIALHLGSDTLFFLSPDLENAVYPETRSCSVLISLPYVTGGFPKAKAIASRSANFHLHFPLESLTFAPLLEIILLSLFVLTFWKCNSPIPSSRNPSLTSRLGQMSPWVPPDPGLPCWSLSHSVSSLSTRVGTREGRATVSQAPVSTGLDAVHLNC